MQEKQSRNRWGDSRPGSTKKFIRFPDQMIKEIELDIEHAKGEKKTSFSEWVKDACNKKLKS
jgi:hypothetical protein